MVCCICGRRIENDEQSYRLSADLPDRLICSGCAARIKKIRKLAQQGSMDYEKVRDGFVSVLSRHEPDDDVLEFIHQYLRRANKAYKEACRAKIPDDVKQGSVSRSDSGPSKPKRSKVVQRLSMLGGVAVVIGALIWFLTSAASTNGCFSTKWTCDECGRKWVGKAYYGITGDETMCSRCAESYWAPMPYEDYEKESSENEEESYALDTSDTYAEPVEQPTDDRTVMAYGEFSEGKAFAFVDGEPCYVDTSGNVLFYLKEDMRYGATFHDGYAVVTNSNYLDYVTSWSPDDPYGLETRFALIDSSGNYVVVPDQYKSISAVSEGKFWCKTVEESYAGTEITCMIKDVSNQTICVVSYGSKRSISSIINDPCIHNDVFYDIQRNVHGYLQYIKTYSMQDELICEVNSLDYIYKSGRVADITQRVISALQHNVIPMHLSALV